MHNMEDKSIYLISAIILLITALFSVGYHQFDEHFHLLEFAGLKLGLTQGNDLAWEYHYQTRAAIQPAIVVLVYSLLSLAKITNPFTIAIFLRVLSGLISFLSIHLFYRVYRREIEDVLLQKWFLLLSFLLWFAVYNNVRFSAENWSGSIFLIAYSLFFLKESESRVQYLLIGILFGLAFLFRYQVGLLIAGFMLWLLFINRQNIAHLILLSSGILFAITLGLLIDWWYYGDWTLTAWNYFEQGIILDKLSEFGVKSWWYYFEAVFIKAIPPISIICILSLLIVLIYKRKDVIIWTILPFIIIQSIIGHKETRYLFPIICFVPILIIKSIELIQNRWFSNLLKTTLFRRFTHIFWAINIVFLIIIAFRPADANTYLYKTIFDNYHAPTTLYYIKSSPYQRVQLEIIFYRRSNLEMREIRSTNEIDLGSDRPCLFVTRNPDSIRETGYTYILIYSTLPEWIKKLNFNNWVERTKLWYVYEIHTAERMISSHHSPPRNL